MEIIHEQKNVIECRLGNDWIYSYELTLLMLFFSSEIKK